MIRRVPAAIIALILVTGLCGCPTRQAVFGPDLPVVFGIRSAEGRLQVWTGSPCVGTTTVNFRFDNAARLTLETPGQALIRTPPPGKLADYLPPDPGVQVEYLTLGETHPGFRVQQPLPAGFDWHTAESMQIRLDGPPISWGSRTTMDEVRRDSADQPADTYWFNGFGWLTPDDVAARDGKDFLTLCHPDPGEKPELPRLFGVRVTDGTLRIWPGAHCTGVKDVIVTFQPGQADLSLRAPTLQSYNVNLSELVVGGPYPSLDIIHPLPDNFDWHTADTVALRVFELTAIDPWTVATELGAARRESAQYPEDTYWFQGFGWLTNSDANAMDGTKFLTACRPGLKIR